MPHQEIRVLSFDTNFARQLMTGRLKDQLDIVNSALRHALRTPFTPLRSAFSFMELIGFNPRDIERPPTFDLSSVNEEAMIRSAGSHFIEHYSSQEILGSTSLSGYKNRQAEYVDNHFSDIWLNLIQGFEGEEAADYLHFSLGFDAVYKTIPPENLRSRFIGQLIPSGFFGADHKIRNMSKYRLAHRLWQRAFIQIQRNNANAEFLQTMREVNNAIGLDNRNDYLDCDIIHQACLGTETANGERHRVTCITCDSPEVIKWRLRIYKGFLQFVRNRYSDQLEAQGYTPDFDTSHNGRVLCFDSNNGELANEIDVTNDVPALSYILDPEPTH